MADLREAVTLDAAKVSPAIVPATVPVVGPDQTPTQLAAAETKAEVSPDIAAFVQLLAPGVGDQPGGIKAAPESTQPTYVSKEELAAERAAFVKGYTDATQRITTLEGMLTQVLQGRGAPQPVEPVAQDALQGVDLSAVPAEALAVIKALMKPLDLRTQNAERRAQTAEIQARDGRIVQEIFNDPAYAPYAKECLPEAMNIAQQTGNDLRLCFDAVLGKKLRATPAAPPPDTATLEATLRKKILNELAIQATSVLKGSKGAMPGGTHIPASQQTAAPEPQGRTTMRQELDMAKNKA